MATEIILPALGETMDEGTIARWIVASGATVSKGQVIAEIESNKAVFELEAVANGVLTVLVAAGATVPILTVIGRISAQGENEAPAATHPAASQPSRETVGTAAAPATPAPASGGKSERHFVSPRARRYARERGIDAGAVSGTGPQGRVEERDVRAYVERRPRLSPLAKKLAAETGLSESSLTGSPKERLMRADIERRAAAVAPIQPPPVSEAITPLSLIRRVIGQRMSESAHSAAGVTLTTEVDAEELVHLREQIKTEVEKQAGYGLSYDVLLARLCAAALAEFPYMNARLAGDAIRTSVAANIGIAVDTDRGLLVPVLRDAGAKSVTTLTREAGELLEKARTGSISADEMAGGTFTITNLGRYGIDAFTPIINLPECAILGVGRIAARPAPWQGQVALRRTCVLSLTFDHRLVDGAPAARFLQRVVELVQNPYFILL